MDPTSDSLNAQFKTEGVRFDSTPTGLIRAVISNELCNGEMYLHGAHVTGFTPRGHDPVLWMSRRSYFDPAKAIRGGVPVCFPWFGPNASSSSLPAHGFARVMKWNVEDVSTNSGGEVQIALSMKSGECTRASWAAEFNVMLTATFGKQLTVNMRVNNTDSAPIRFEQALHSYFAVSDVKQISIEGLQGAGHLDRLQPGKMFTDHEPAIRFTGETDRTYLDTTSTCVLHDPGLRRRIDVAKHGSRSTVIWNPWVAKGKAMADFGEDAWPEMVCIETANAGPNAITLSAGHAHEMSATISVERS